MYGSFKFHKIRLHLVTVTQLDAFNLGAEVTD
jgi:hypothetical protein